MTTPGISAYREFFNAACANCRVDEECGPCAVREYLKASCITRDGGIPVSVDLEAMSCAVMVPRHDPRPALGFSEGPGDEAWALHHQGLCVSDCPHCLPWQIAAEEEDLYPKHGANS